MDLKLIKTKWINKFDLFYWNKLPHFIFAFTLIIYPVFWVISWLRIIVKKLFGVKPSVVWGPTPLINISESSQIMKRLGYNSKTVVYTTYHITQDFNIILKKYLQNQRTAIFLPHVIFLWSLLKFDIYHFFYDFGFWSGMNIYRRAKWIEFPLLRLAGKRIIASAYGADVRVQYLNEMWPVNICKECPDPSKHCICDLGTANINAKYYRDWVNVCLAMGDMHDYVFDSKVDFNYWPIDTDKIGYVGVRQHDGPIRIVHSPNHRHFKGTRFIQASIDELKEKGYNVELILVEGVPNHVAKQMYAEADIIAAQCILGWPGYTEIEGMAAGKPVITYIRNINKYLAHSPGCPMISLTPETLTEKLEELINSFELRREYGMKGREYVEKEWSYHALMPRYDRLHKEVWNKNELIKTIINKIRDFRKGDTGYRVSNHIGNKKLGEWPVFSDGYLNLRRIEHGCYGQPPFDESGLLRVYYNGQYVKQPGTISLCAMNAFHCILNEPDNKKYLDIFYTHVDWLFNNLHVDDSGVGRWWYEFEAPSRDNMGKRWLSCFSQSLGISMMLRAYQLSGDTKYLEKASQAINLYRVPLSQQGILWEDENGTYLEEYPEIPPAHVLNGFITGLFGLYEFNTVTEASWGIELFDKCTETLIKILPLYEAAKGLRYDLRNEYIVNADYYYFIIQQLKVMYKISGRKEFLHWATRWKKKMYKLKLKGFISGSAPI